jgi:Flp pilus assembly protein protease CpaA
MITTLIIIYLVSVIGAWFTMRKGIIDNKVSCSGFLVVLITICPIINIILTIMIFFTIYNDKSEDISNWFFKIPKR